MIISYCGVPDVNSLLIIACIILLTIKPHILHREDATISAAEADGGKESRSCCSPRRNVGSAVTGGTIVGGFC